jgi:hypothetical protein
VGLEGRAGGGNLGAEGKGLKGWLGTSLETWPSLDFAMLFFFCETRPPR